MPRQSFPSRVSRSTPRSSTKACTFSASCSCSFFSFTRSALLPPTTCMAPQVSMQAMGFRSLATTSQPSRAAAKGICPLPQKVSATTGRRP